MVVIQQYVLAQNASCAAALAYPPAPEPATGAGRRQCRASCRPTGAAPGRAGRCRKRTARAWCCGRPRRDRRRRRRCHMGPSVWAEPCVRPGLLRHRQRGATSVSASASISARLILVFIPIVPSWRWTYLRVKLEPSRRGVRELDSDLATSILLTNGDWLRPLILAKLKPSFNEPILSFTDETGRLRHVGQV